MVNCYTYLSYLKAILLLQLLPGNESSDFSPFFSHSERLLKSSDWFSFILRGKRSRTTRSKSFCHFSLQKLQGQGRYKVPEEREFFNYDKQLKCEYMYSLYLIDQCEIF